MVDTPNTYTFWLIKTTAFTNLVRIFLFGHRTVGYSDPDKVAELLGLASLLMKLIDQLP
jgi:hypothetical protein